MAVNIRHTLTETSYDIASNTSQVRYVVKVTTSGSSYNNNERSSTIYVNGVKYTAKHKLPKTSTTTVFDKTVTVTHESDGKKTVSASYSVPTGISAGTLTGSKNLNLTTIPRTTSIGNTTATIGVSTTLKISPASNTFTHTLTYKFGNVTGTIWNKTSAMSGAFTFPESLYAQIPNARGGTGILTLQTYSGNTLIGTSTATLTINANASSCTPTISKANVTTTDDLSHMLTGNNTTVIKGVSNISVDIEGQTKNYGTPRTLKIGDTAITSTVTQSGGTYNVNTIFSETSSSRTKYNVYLDDRRDYSVTKVVSASIVSYIPPSIVSNWARLTPTGDIIKLKSLSGNVFNGSFGAVNNELHLKYRYKQQDAEEFTEWIDISNKLVISDNNTYKFDNSEVTIEGVDYKQTCIIEMQLSDKIRTVPTTIPIKAGEPIWYWTKNKFVAHGNRLDKLGNFAKFCLGGDIAAIEGDNALSFGWIHDGKGNDFSISETGSIIVGKGIKKVMITGQYYFYTGSVPQRPVLYVYINDTLALTEGVRCEQQYLHVAMTTVIRSVKEGDEIKIIISSLTPGTIIKNYTHGTFVNVMVIG